MALLKHVGIFFQVSDYYGLPRFSTAVRAGVAMSQSGYGTPSFENTHMISCSPRPGHAIWNIIPRSQANHPVFTRSLEEHLRSAEATVQPESPAGIHEWTDQH